MKKSLVLSVAILVVTSQVYSLAFASSNKGSAINVAIKKYKSGNYTGCLQDATSIVQRDPSNAVAHYYMAMSYAQAGRKDKAVEAYQKVLDLKPNATLVRYATTGKRCIETPDKCKETDQSSEVDRMVTSPYGDGLSNEVRKSIEQKRLDSIKNEINNNKDVNNYEFKQFNDNTKQHSEAPAENKIAEEKQPTNDDIVAAIKVLNKAGINPYSQIGATLNPYAQVNPQSAEMAQVNMLMNGNNQGNNNNNNNMMNMLPYMLAQKNGQSGGYSPQLMQAMMMNSMLPDMNFNTNDNK